MFKNRVINCVLTALLLVNLFIATPAYAKPNPKYASIVMDAETGRILRARNADKRLHPASLTKMMTLFLTFEALEDGRLKMNQYLRFSHKASNQQPSKIGLKPGSYIRVKDAVLALVTKSANDVAVVLAEALAGSEYQFANMMTQKARQLGMNSTTFKNASGLHHPKQISTARDMAILSRSLMQYFPHYYHFFSTNKFHYKGKNYKNHNKLMTTYHGMDGLKTGYIRAAGFNLAASAVRDNRRLIGVVFGGRSGKTRNAHMAKILDESFARISKTTTKVAYNTLPPIPSKKPTIKAVYAELDSTNYNHEIISEGDSDYELIEEIKLASIDQNSITNKRELISVQNSENKDWGIQVGAFKTRIAGEKALQDTRSSLTVIPSQARSVITPLQTEDGIFFRARIMGISVGIAKNACQLLTDCLIVNSP